MNKKKFRKLQTIPRNGKGQKVLGPQPITIIITALGKQVQINGFPSDLDKTIDILHSAEKAVNNFFMREAIIRAAQPQEPIKKREYMGPRPSEV